MRRHSALALFGIIGGLLLTLGGPWFGSAPVAYGSGQETAGYSDFSFQYPGMIWPTGDKPQSKLWYNDGLWWADMFNATTKTWHIYWLDIATQNWNDRRRDLFTLEFKERDAESIVC